MYYQQMFLLCRSILISNFEQNTRDGLYSDQLPESPRLNQKENNYPSYLEDFPLSR